MKSRHVAALVIGCLLALPGIGMLLGGAGLAAASAWARDDAGFFSWSLRTVQTPTAAVTAEDVVVDYGPERWVAEQFAVDVRLRVTPTEPGQAIFAGVAEQSDVAAYLSGTAHDRITRIDRGAPHYSRVSGAEEIATPPTDQTFWTAQVSGTGTQTLDWELTGGNWAIVLMNADGSPGVSTAVTMGARADFVIPLAWTLVGIGLVVTAIAAALIGFAVAGRERVTEPHAPALAAAAPGTAVALHSPGTPVVLTAQLDPQLSRAMWLVKWFLAIPHFIVLAFLWAAFGVVTIIAWFAILFTGRYPRQLFDFNVGVMRWTWRVSYYAGEGGLGSDRYPAFSLEPAPEDLTTLDIAYPERLSRGLIFVKWFLAIPHLLITGLLVGSVWRWSQEVGDEWRTDYEGVGVLGLLVFVAAVVLLVTGSYQRGLFDLIIGLNRWVYRVGAYVALMTDEYPPFRLDMGGMEGQLPTGPGGPGAPYGATDDVPPPVAPPPVAPPPVAPPTAQPGGVPADAPGPAVSAPPRGAAITELPPPEDR
jgi:hypothetical protein